MPKDDWKRASDRARYGVTSPPEYRGGKQKRRRKRKAKPKVKPKAEPQARCPHCGKLLSEPSATKKKSKASQANAMAWAVEKMTEGAEVGDSSRIDGPYRWARNQIDDSELLEQLKATYRQAIDLCESVCHGRNKDAPF